MKHQDELRELIEIAEIPVERLSIHGKIKKTNCAKWAIGEIRRLRAKNNRLIRVYNQRDANGNHIGEHYAETEDLVLEEEI